MKLLWKTTRRLAVIAEEITRLIAMLLILTPSSRFLPRAIALRCADAVALALMFLPLPGFVAYRQMKRSFGLGNKEALLLGHRWVAGPLRDFVIMNRITSEREDPATWEIVENNTTGIEEIRRKGLPHIVATGHFSRPAYLGLLSPKISGGRVFEVSGVPPKLVGISELRMHWAYSATISAIKKCWDQLTVIWVGDNPTAGLKLYRQLLRRNTTVVIHVDAWWPDGAPTAYKTSFAGSGEKTFSLGAVQLAEQSCCPIIPCAYLFENDRVVIDWGDPIFPAAGATADSAANMETLLKFLEGAIGRHPAQYVVDIGQQRKWNKHNQRWESRNGE